MNNKPACSDLKTREQTAFTFPLFFTVLFLAPASKQLSANVRLGSLFWANENIRPAYRPKVINNRSNLDSLLVKNFTANLDHSVSFQNEFSFRDRNYFTKRLQTTNTPKNQVLRELLHKKKLI